MAHVLRADRAGAMKLALLLGTQLDLLRPASREAMKVALLLVVCACNSIYGLDATRLQDGAGPDAPAVCLNGPLAFDPQVRQIVFDDCTDYTFAGGKAVALCDLFSVTQRLAEGPIDQALETVGITPHRQGSEIVMPRLTPEGELLVGQRIIFGTSTILSIYTRGSDSWVWNRDLPIPDLNSEEYVGVPSRGSAHRMMIKRGSRVDEAIEGDSNTWTIVPRPFSDFGVQGIRGPINLSADGLRAVFLGDGGMRYAVRAGVDAPFTSYPLDVPLVTDAVLSEDCARLYFSGLESIFHVQR
jgi:hypothetical protein